MHERWAPARTLPVALWLPNSGCVTHVVPELRLAQWQLIELCCNVQNRLRPRCICTYISTQCVVVAFYDDDWRRQIVYVYVHSAPTLRRSSQWQCCNATGTVDYWRQTMVKRRRLHSKLRIQNPQMEGDSPWSFTSAMRSYRVDPTHPCIPLKLVAQAVVSLRVVCEQVFTTLAVRVMGALHEFEIITFTRRRLALTASNKAWSLLLTSLAAVVLAIAKRLTRNTLGETSIASGCRRREQRQAATIIAQRQL